MVVTPSAEWTRRYGARSGRGRPRGAAAGRFDRLARELVRLQEEEARSLQTYGEWDFGDWRFFDGWGNLEFDTAKGLWSEYERTRDPGARRMALQALRHWCDVDRKTWGAPGFEGLPRMHGPEHGHRVELGHVWIEGVLSVYRATGDLWLGDAFEETAEALVRVLGDRPQAALARERDAAWTLRALAAVADARPGPAGRTVRRAARDLIAAVVQGLEGGHGLPRFPDSEARGAEGAFRISPWESWCRG